MPFPTSPTNGQIATVNGITYAYSSASTAWKKVTSSVGNLTVTNTLTTGNISAGNISVSGRIVATGNVQGNFIVGDGSKLTNTVSTGKAIAMSIVFGG
jgi:hypothetical protein